MKLAIDFGTTNTVITRWTAGGAEVLPLPGLSSTLDGAPSLLPSLLYVQDGQAAQVSIGQAVRDLAFDQQRDNRLFRNFKRGIAAQPSPPPRLIDGAAWDDRQAGEHFIRRLIDSLPPTPEGIEQVVLTAPVAAFEDYLTWLAGAMDRLGAERVYMVDESTAAALGYAVTEPGAPVLVLDFGGGTLDLSLVQLPESRDTTGGLLSRLRRGNTRQRTAQVIAKAGRTLGGSDIDQWLLAEVLRRLDLTAVDLGDGFSTLLTACEQAKIQLSTAQQTDLTLYVADRSHTLTLTRADLESLLEQHGFYQALRHAVDKVMHMAHRGGVFREDVKYVLLVGGISLMPSVQRTLRDYFDAAAIRAEKPFTAVAEGALQVIAGYGLDDYLGQGYGLRYLNAQGQPGYEEIIPMGSRYPTEKPIEVMLGASHADQTTIELIIGEISDESGSMVQMRYEGGQAVFVADLDGSPQQVNPLNADHPIRVPLHPPGQPDEDRLRLRLWVDSARRLQLNVHDLKTRQDLLKDTVIARLQRTEPAAAPALSAVSGCEPALRGQMKAGNQRRLSLRGLATMFNILPPESISLDAAEAALRSDSFQARYSAALALRQRADREARLVFQRVLMDGRVPARASAARHLGGFSWYSAEPLLRHALTDSDSRVREGAVYALCDLRDLNAYRLLSEALSNEADNVREAATTGLRDCHDPAAVPVLQAVLRAEDPEVRIKALEVLSANHTAPAIPVVRASLADEDTEVVYAAVLSLLELTGDGALEELVSQIMETCGERREAILRGFFHATNYLSMDLVAHPLAGRLIAACAMALRDGLPAVRKAVIWPLAWMRHPGAADLLQRAYEQETDAEVKAHIIRVAVNLMSLNGETLLQAALHSEVEAVQQTAQQIVAERARTGVTVQFDETAGRGSGLMNLRQPS